MAVRRQIRRRVRRARSTVRRAPSSSTTAARTEAKQNVSADTGVMIGGVHDPAEKAADQTADRVMRMPASSPVVHRKSAVSNVEDEKIKRTPQDQDQDEKVQRVAQEAGEEEKVQRVAQEPGEEEMVQTKPVQNSTPIAAGISPVAAPSGASTAIRSMGGGHPLTQTDRAFFEPRFDADLSSIRVHDGPAADLASRAINARAFSLGKNIAFAQGEHQPGTDRGRHLMAHELAHVTHNGASQGVARRKIKTEITGKNTSLEYKFRHDYGVKGVKRSGNDYTIDKADRSGKINKEIASSMLVSTRTFNLAGTGLNEAEVNLRDHFKARRAIIRMARKIRIKFSVSSDTILSEVLKFVSDEAKRLTEAEITAKHDPLKMPKSKLRHLYRKIFKKHVLKLLFKKAGDKKFKKAAALVLKKSQKFDKSKALGKVEPYAAACFVTSAMVVFGAGGPVEVKNVNFDPKDTLRKSTIWTDWVPGDWGYIKNVDPAPKAGEEGENIIYIGKNRFWGHFPGSKGSNTLEQLFNMVAGWNKEDKASLLPFRRYPKKGLKK